MMPPIMPMPTSVDSIAPRLLRALPPPQRVAPLLRLLPLRWHRAVIAAAVAMVTVIGVSRILLQVHYFSYVLAGYASGLAWLVVCLGAAEWWRLRRKA